MLNGLFKSSRHVLHLAVMNNPYLESGEKSQSYVLTFQINQLIFMNGSQIVFNWLVHLKYLFINTHNTAPIPLGYNQLLH